MTRGQGNMIVMRDPDGLKFTGYFQGQANLDTGKVARYYYNTHARVTSKNPLKYSGPRQSNKFGKSKNLKLHAPVTTINQPSSDIQR